MEKEMYTPPTAEIVEVDSEGVFCISGQNEKYQYQEFPW